MNINVGPGAYNCKGTSLSKISYTMRSRPNEKLKYNFPGPG